MQKQIMVLKGKRVGSANDSIYDTFVAKTLWFGTYTMIQFIDSQNPFKEKSCLLIRCFHWHI